MFKKGQEVYHYSHDNPEREGYYTITRTALDYQGKLLYELDYKYNVPEHSIQSAYWVDINTTNH